MTLPEERAWALINARTFLTELTDPKLTPKVPKAIRKRASSLLRHYPWPDMMSQWADRKYLDYPTVVGKTK